MGLEVTETFKVTEAGLDEFTITSRLMRKARLSTAECALSVGRFLEMAIGIEDKDI